MDAERLVRGVPVVVPELAIELGEHEEYFDGLLPHVFFGVVTTWAEAHAGGRESDASLDALLDYLDESFATGDESAQDVIGVSFLEFLDEAVVARLGPVLRAEHTRIHAS